MVLITSNFKVTGQNTKTNATPPGPPNKNPLQPSIVPATLTNKPGFKSFKSLTKTFQPAKVFRSVIRTPQSSGPKTFKLPIKTFQPPGKSNSPPGPPPIKTFLPAAPQQHENKTFFCVFCKDIVSLAVGKLTQFKSHMESVHKIFYEFDILLALNFIDRKEKEKIIEGVKHKMNGSALIVKDNSTANPRAEENLLREDGDWGNLDNVQVVILDENTSIKDALKKASAPTELQQKTEEKTSKTIISEVKTCPPSKVKPITKIKQEPIIKSEPGEIRSDIKAETIEVSPEIPGKDYQCEKCNKIFPNKSNLKVHLNKKLSCLKPVLQCEKCLKILKDKQAFKIHMARTKSCVRPHCEKCGKKFQGRKAYKVHVERKRSCVKPNFQCEKCNKSFNIRKNYEIHMARTKSCVKPNLKCEDCLKVFSNSSSLKSHLSNKENVCKKRIPCEKCGKAVRESKYKLHLNKKRGCVPVSLKCDGCLKTFSTRAAARYHQLKKDKVCKKRIECERCGERYREELYKKHIIRSCVKVECEKCGEKFSEYKLKQHLLKKRSCVVEEPKCDDCGKTFSTHASAKKHMQDQKGQCNMKFGCENCGNSFNGLHSLKMHMRTNKQCLKIQQAE